MLGLRILDFVCLDQLIQERTVFRNIGFFLVFLWILDHPNCYRDWFFWILFWFFFGSLDQVLFGYWCSCESINLTFTNILLKY